MASWEREKLPASLSEVRWALCRPVPCCLLGGPLVRFSWMAPSPPHHPARLGWGCFPDVPRESPASALSAWSPRSEMAGDSEEFGESPSQGSGRRQRMGCL